MYNFGVDGVEARVVRAGVVLSGLGSLARWAAQFWPHLWVVHGSGVSAESALFI